jgi:hypothetical protein
VTLPAVPVLGISVSVSSSDKPFNIHVNTPQIERIGTQGYPEELKLYKRSTMYYIARLNLNRQDA